MRRLVENQPCEGLMRRIRIALVLTVALTAGPSFAETVGSRKAQFDRTWEEARYAALSLGLYSYLIGSWTVVDFRYGLRHENTCYGVGPDDPASHICYAWTATKTVMDGHGQLKRYVTDQHTCPAIIVALTSAENVAIPRIDLPSVGRPAPKPEAVMDGGLAMLRSNSAYFSTPLARGAVQISGNADSPVSEWATNALRWTDDCWRQR